LIFENNLCLNWSYLSTILQFGNILFLPTNKKNLEKRKKEFVVYSILQFLPHHPCSSRFSAQKYKQRRKKFLWLLFCNSTETVHANTLECTAARLSVLEPKGAAADGLAHLRLSTPTQKAVPTD
jgi:hypothetical protein